MIKPIVRQPAVAGTFYPDDENELHGMIEEFLAKAKETGGNGRLRGLVVPHAGYVYSGPIAAYGYKALAKEIEKRQIKKILLVGPSHFAAFFGIAESGAEFWETPLGKVKTESIRSRIKNKESVALIPEAHAREHCLEVQFPFLQTVMKTDFSVYPLLVSEASAAALGEMLDPLLDDSTIFIASSDLSHYHPYEKAVALDTVCNNAIPNQDIETMEEKGEACGKLPIMALMHIAKKRGWNGKLLNYRNSGDTAGDKGQVVGYGCYAFYES